MKCFIICRQSSGDNDESLSIDSQFDECRRLCDKEGIEIVDEFADYNTSGRLYPKGFESLAAIDLIYQNWVKDTGKKNFRIGLSKALNRLNEVDYIVCYDMTRLYRPLNGSYLANLINQLLLQSNVKLFTIKEGIIDFSNFSDNLVTSLTSFINSEQINITKEKTKKSLRKLRNSGEWCVTASRSFGYRGLGRRIVEIDEEKAEIVRKIYDMYLSGYKFTEIYQEINKDYIPKHGKPVRLNMITIILKNSIYCGYYKDTEGNLVKSIPTEGKEIIDYDTWKTVQDIMASRKKSPCRARRNWLPLGGKIYCGECGEKLPLNCRHLKWTSSTGYHEIRYVEYRCQTHVAKCLGSAMSCNTSVHWDELKKVVLPLCALHYVEKLKSSMSDNASKRESISITKDNVKAKIAKLNRMYAEDALDEDSFERTVKTLNARIKELDRELTNIELENGSDYSSTKFLADMTEILSGDFDKKEASISLMYTIQKIIVYQMHITIVTKFGSFDLPFRRRSLAKKLPVCLEAYDEQDDGTYNVELIYTHEDAGCITNDNKGHLLLDTGRVKIYLA